MKRSASCKRIIKDLLALLFLLVCTFASADEKKIKIRIDNDQRPLPRYSGIALGGYFTNKAAVGSLSDYMMAGIGGGAAIELTLPQHTEKVDFGFSASSEYFYILPAENSIVLQASDIKIQAGAWIHIPYAFRMFDVAFQPEISFGFITRNAKFSGSSKKDGWYTHQFIAFTPSFRLAILNNRQLELEFAPQVQLSFESYKTFFQAGFKFGAIYHFARR